ncbi:MAG: PilZ domain-containing protein [Fimbriimonadales bacterium]|nr:PilZ domain-containing protein [Fimbriimonadales bacterium]
MMDGASLGIGLGLALLGGLLIALSGRRWGLCPFQHCPALEAGQRVEFTVANKRYTTLLHSVDGETLLLTPPLERGIPVSFEAGSFAELRLTTPAGVFEAPIQFIGRQAKPEPRLFARVAGRWKHTQRRRHERVLLPDEVNVAIRRAGEQWIGWARDASVGGLRLIAPAPAPLNAQVRLELPPALRGITDSDAERTARVVACDRAPTRHGYAYQLRLAFIDE